MKRAFFCILILTLVGCTPAQPELVPVNTAVALTMAAAPKTETPEPLFTEIPQSVLAAMPVTPSPEINLSAPGAYCVPTNTNRTRALVTRVLDGNTIEVAVGNDALRVRYLGITAPGVKPLVEWQGPQAIAGNGDLVSGKYVVLVKDISDIDVDGALLRYVFIDNLFVNYELLRRGLSRVNIIQPDAACEQAFLAAQYEAQIALQGVWSPTPIPTATIIPTAISSPTPSVMLKPVCNCSGERLTCKNFRTQAKAQACFEYCKAIGKGDIFGLDKNDNGKACEGMD